MLSRNLQCQWEVREAQEMVLENGGLTDVYVKNGAHGEGGWRRNSAWRSGAGPQLSVAPTHTPLWSAEHMGHPRNPFCCPFLLEVCHLPLEIFFFFSSGEIGFLSYHDIYPDGNLKKL